MVANTARLAKLEADFARLQKQNQREKNKLKQALKKLEANDRKQQKEYYIERANERKEFFWQLLQQLGYKFDDICIIGGSLAILKEKIDAGNATEEINACIAKYYELIKDPDSGIEDKRADENNSEDSKVPEAVAGNSNDFDGIDA